MKNSDTTLIDVRTREEFSNEQISSAINIPLDELQHRIAEIQEMPQPIIMYCASGNRSGMAVSILKQNGITNVSNGGGIEDLKQQFSN